MCTETFWLSFFQYQHIVGVPDSYPSSSCHVSHQMSRESYGCIDSTFIWIIVDIYQKLCSKAKVHKADAM